MVNPNDKDGMYAVILFLIWPFLAAVSAVWNFRRPWAKNIFWLFCIFYGFTFAIGTESEGSDIVRYVAEYQELHGKSMDYTAAVNYYQQSGEIDIMRTAIAVTLSRFSDSQPVLTLVYAILFGFFYSRNLWYVMERMEGRVKPITILLLSCFFLVIPIWEINGFRMWTAAHVFLYGMLPFLFEGKIKGLWVSSLSVLFHFSFILPVFLLFSFAFLGNWLTLYFGFFLLTLFISEINLEVINNFIDSYAPEIFKERTAGYRIEDDAIPGESVVRTGQSRRWYAVWYGRALKYAITAFLIALFVTGRKYIEQHKGWLNLFCFILIFYGVANLMGSISSGGRFIRLANLIALPLIILYLQNIPLEKIMNRFLLFVTPALLLFVIVALRTGLYSLSATTIFGNVVVAYFTYGQFMSMNDFLKSLL